MNNIHNQTDTHPPEAPMQRMVGSRQEMEEILSETLLAAVDPVITAEMVTPVVTDQGRCRTLRHQVRLKTMTNSVNGITKNLSHRAYREMVKAALYEFARIELQHQLPGEWVLAGFELSLMRTKRVGRRQNPNPEHWEQWQEGDDVGGGKAKPMRTVYETFYEDRILVRLAFVEKLGTPYSDPWTRTPGEKNLGSHQQFAATQNYMLAPASIRKSIEDGLELLEKYREWAAGRIVVADDDGAVPLDGATLTMAKMLLDQGVAWSAVADAAGYPSWQRLRSDMVAAGIELAAVEE